ncbi:MAG TPA: aldehyde dehydrogenase family protein [Steroidobacteraceae bacterium]|nr:aldehyde dehydrogenase family protein [Steroidobacteraceae bacterium]
MHKILIDGAWVEALARAGREINNPATLAPQGVVAECGAPDVGRAVAAAKSARSAWRRMPGADKAALLGEIGARVRAQGQALAMLSTQECGSPLCESRDDVVAAAACFEQGAAAAHDGGSAGAGVVAAIVSFENPLWRMARILAPAIAAGHTAVCKPPQQNPLSSLKLAELFARLPRGVVNVVTGGAATADALLEHADVDRLAFAGSAAAGIRQRELTLEDCAAGASIVFKDADLDLAVPGVAWARLRHAGQACGAGKRIVVERAIAAQFADRLHEYVGMLEVGDPLKSDTDLGPLISAEAVSRVGDQVAYALKDGARLKLGGLRFKPWGLPGYFFQPTIMTEIGAERLAAHEQICGPVLSIVAAADAEEAIRIAHHGECAVNASVYTQDPCIALWAAQAAASKHAHAEHVTARKACWFPYRDRG